MKESEETKSPESVRPWVIGVGGAGLSVVDLVAAKSEEFDLMAVDSDASALSGCMATAKIEVGTQEVRGLGCYGDARFAAELASGRMGELQAMIGEAEMVFLVGGLGGGMGSGALPLVAEAVRSTGARVIAVVTMPLPVEPSYRMATAEAAIRSLRAQCDAVIPLPYAGLLPQLPPNASAHELFDVGIGGCFQVLSGLHHILYHSGLIELDPEKVFDVLRHVPPLHGAAGVAVAEGDGSTRLDGCLRDIAHAPLLADSALRSACSHALVCLSSGGDLTLIEIQHVKRFMRQFLPGVRRLTLGATVDPSCKDTLRMLVVACGEGRQEEESAGGCEINAQPEEVFLEEELDETIATEQETSSPSARSQNVLHRGGSFQPDLRFDQPSRGRFDKTESTLHNGEDLDVPTFLRRNRRIRQVPV
jgi:cell division protein FtsZ